MTPGSAPLLSVVVPTVGNEARFAPFLGGMERQTLARDRWELIVVFDGAKPSAALAARLESLGARRVVLEARSGPPVARNAGAAAARGEYLVSTDDDVMPGADWLARAAARLDADPSLDVIEGVTQKPGGRPVRRAGAEEARQYILCNLVMRRSLFQRVGGFHTGYFEPESGMFFREDADIGWKLEAVGARVARGEDVVVVHPEENPRWLDPLRWTRRYVMDGLLAARFPREFRERIEVHRLGPFTVRRPIVRSSVMFLLLLAAALGSALGGRADLGALFAAVAALVFLPVWAKWRFDPVRLPVILFVPFGLAWAMAHGWFRAARVLEAGSETSAAERARRSIAQGFALAVLAAIAVTRVPYLLAGPDAQLSLMMDDAAYYLEGARRAVESRAWPSMDGWNFTNGFHPLYMALLVGIQSVIGTVPRIVVPVVMTLQLAFGAAAIALLCRRLARDGVTAGVVAVGVMLALDPGWTGHGLCGVENGLSSLLLLLAALRWERRFGGEEAGAGGARAWAADGALLGLAMAARTDAAIFALPYLSFGAARAARRSGAAAALRGALLAGATAFLVISPWLLANLARFGTIVQDSSAALAARYAAQYGPRLSPGSLRVSASILVFWWFRALWAGGLVPLTGWALGLALPLARTRVLRHTRWIGWGVAALSALSLLLRANDSTDIRDARVAAVELALGTLAFAAGALTARPSRALSRPARLMLGAWAALIVIAYAFGFRGFQVWYSTGLCLAGVLLAAGPELASALRGRAALAATFVLLMGAQASLLTGETLRRGTREGMHPGLLADGAALRARFEALASTGKVRVGCFDSGKLSYTLHPFPLVNVDGVMNHRASVALRTSRLADYFAEDGITHLIGNRARLAEFVVVSPFEASTDQFASALLGVPVCRVDRLAR